MSAIYQAQKAYYQIHGKYSSDLVLTGFAPEGTNRYVVGLSNHCGDQNTNSFKLPGLNENFQLNMRQEFQLQARKYLSENPCSPNFPQEFEAYALGDLGGNKLDIWRIDNNKNLVNIQYAADPSPGRIEFNSTTISFLLITFGLLPLLSLGWIKIISF